MLFALLRGGKQTDSINGTLPSYQKIQEEEPQKKLPGNVKYPSCVFIVSSLRFLPWNVNEYTEFLHS